MAKNIFLEIVKGNIPCDKVFENEEFLAFRDINPQAPTHILIIPKREIPTLNDLEEKDAELVGKMVLLARDIAAKEGIAESGYRTIFNCNRDAGQAVYHIHLHLLGGRPMGWPPG